MKIQKAAEDYLEAMLMLKERKGYIRSVDIADLLKVTKPTVSYSVKRLRENGYIVMDSGGLITLTDAGMDIAGRIYARHKLLIAFLESLGVNRETACEDACKMEHDISEATFRAVSAYMKKTGVKF